MNRRKGILFLSVSWVLLLFMLSLQSASVSHDLSIFFIRKFLVIFVPDKVQTEESLYLVFCNLVHFFMYLILGGLIYIILYQTRCRCKMRIAFVTSVVVALIDEGIQFFTNGRTASVQDVLLDCAGALAGIFIYFLFVQDQ